jgi:hypothetical protein
MPQKPAKKRAKKTVKPGAILRKIKKDGHKSLTMEECCRLVWYQLEKIQTWEQDLADWLSPSGGGGTPPQPPPWPPK